MDCLLTDIWCRDIVNASLQMGKLLAVLMEIVGRVTSDEVIPASSSFH